MNRPGSDVPLAGTPISPGYTHRLRAPKSSPCISAQHINQQSPREEATKSSLPAPQAQSDPAAGLAHSARPPNLNYIPHRRPIKGQTKRLTNVTNATRRVAVHSPERASPFGFPKLQMS